MEGPVAFDRLCETCESLFDSQTSKEIISEIVYNEGTQLTTNQTQKRSYEVFLSAKERCHLCNIAQRCLSRSMGSIFHSSDANAIVSTSIKQGRPQSNYGREAIIRSHYEGAGSFGFGSNTIVSQVVGTVRWNNNRSSTD
jgi:hypothetical protein